MIKIKKLEKELWEASDLLRADSKVASQYKSGESSLKEFATAFDNYTPVMPLAYRRGVLYTSADMDRFEAMSPWALYGDATNLATKETELRK